MRPVLLKLRSFYLITGLSGGLFFPYLSILLTHDGMTSGQIGTIMSLGTFIGMVAQPLWGVVVDRFEFTRITLMLSSLIPGLLAVLYDIHWLYILALANILSTLFSTPQAPISDAFAISVAHREGTSYGTIRCFGSIGFSLGGYIGGLYLSHFAVTSLWAIYAALALLGALIAFVLPKPLSDAAGQVSIQGGLRQLVTNRAFLLFLVGGFLVSETLTSFNTYFALTFHSIGGSMAQTGIAFFIASATNVPAMLLAARVINRLGRGRTMMVAAIAYVMRWGVQALFPIPLVAILIQILHGTSFGFFYVSAVNHVAQTTQKELQATGQSIFGIVCGGLAGIFGNLVNGFLLHAGGPELMNWVCAASSAIGAICFWLVGRSHGSKVSHPTQSVSV